MSINSSLNISSMNNDTTGMDERYDNSSGWQDLICPDYGADGNHLIEFFNFWFEGVVKCIIAFTGFIANFVSAVILMKEDMRNSFNSLLVALICMDSCYLVGGVLESFRQSFEMATTAHIVLFPYFLFPALSIAMTGSVYMTVAIAIERYVAVHYPIDYSQSVNSPEACRKRLCKYVIPVVIISIVINIPKFLESSIVDVYSVYDPKENITSTYHYDPKNSSDTEKVITHESSHVSVTSLRKNPDYAIYYTTWTRFFIIGIIPTLLLIYFNYKIYQDVKNRNARQMSRNAATTTQQARRKQEDNLAVVFMGIVLVFLVCHFPRNLLSFVEMLTIQTAIDCAEMDQAQWPLWALLTYNISDVLLAINSSTNMILYIFLNKAFRFHFVNMVKVSANFICSLCRRNYQPVNSLEDTLVTVNLRTHNGPAKQQPSPTVMATLV